MKKLVALSTLAVAFSGLTVASTAVTAAASESHVNCVTFDNNGNIVSVVPNCNEQIQDDNVPPQVSAGANPCTGDQGTQTVYTRHSTFKVNVNGAGDVWITSTQNGTATFVPNDPTLPVYAGTWTSWFGASLNSKNSVLHDTFTFRVSDSLGDTIVMHMLDHISFSATGMPNISSVTQLTCN